MQELSIFRTGAFVTMSSGMPLSQPNGYAAVAALAPLGSFPLLGFALTGFILGGMLPFGPAFGCLLLMAVAAPWLRQRTSAVSPGTRASAPSLEARHPFAGRLAALWALANIGLYAAMFHALSDDAWLVLLAVVAGLAWAARPARQAMPAIASGFALLAFYPVCLGLIASCANASTWPQLFSTSPPRVGAWDALSGLTWLVLAGLASERQQPGRSVLPTAFGHWKLRLASCCLLKLPAGLLGLMVAAAYYDVHGFRGGFLDAFSWAVGRGDFCAPWFVAMVMAAGFLTLIPVVLDFVSGGRRGSGVSQRGAGEALPVRHKHIAG